MKQLYFVRHGQSLMNQQGIFAGQIETPLTDEGREQARQAGLVLKKLTIDCIVASPLSRTMETAEIIASVIGYPVEKILRDQDLEERGYGPLEGTTYQPNLGDEPGVETIDNLLVRANRALKHAKSLPYDCVLIVSHGAVGRALRHIVDPAIPFSPSPNFENGQVVELKNA